MVPLALAWSEAYRDEANGMGVAVGGGGSGTGLAALVNGTAELAFSSRRIRETEIEAGRDISEGRAASSGYADEPSASERPEVERVLRKLHGLSHALDEIDEWLDTGEAARAQCLAGVGSVGTCELTLEHLDLLFAFERCGRGDGGGALR